MKRTLPFMNLTSLESERGALLTLLIKSLLRITASNLLPVLLTKNLYSCTRRKISLNKSTINKHIIAHRCHYLDEKLEVDIIGLWSSPFGLLALTSRDKIDTLQQQQDLMRNLALSYRANQLTSEHHTH